MKPKDQLKAEGEARNAKWRALSPRQQLDNLATRPGKCAKQVFKICKLVEEVHV